MKNIKLILIIFIALNLSPFIFMFFVGFDFIDLNKLFMLTLNTFLLAVFSVILSFLFALPSAYLFTYKTSISKYMIIILLFCISIVPPFLLSISFSNLFFFLNIKNGFLSLCFSHMIVIFPYTLVFLVLGFSYVPKSARYQAKLYASNFIKGFIMFYFPFMKSTFLLAFILGMTISMSQYIITLMLTKPGFSTLMLEIIPYLKSADLKSASSYGIVFIINSALVIYLVYKTFRSKNVIS